MLGHPPIVAVIDSGAGEPLGTTWRHHASRYGPETVNVRSPAQPQLDRVASLWKVHRANINRYLRGPSNRFRHIPVRRADRTRPTVTGAHRRRHFGRGNPTRHARRDPDQRLRAVLAEARPAAARV